MVKKENSTKIKGYVLIACLFTATFVSACLFFGDAEPSNNSPMSLEDAKTVIAQASMEADNNPIHGTASPREAAALQTAYWVLTQRAATRSSNSSTQIPGNLIPSGQPTTSLNISKTNSPVKINPADETDEAQINSLSYRLTHTPKPLSTHTNTITPVFNFTLTPTLGPGIQGLKVSDVITTLENDKSFQCEESGSNDLVKLWTCDYHEGFEIWYHVDIYRTNDIPLYNLVVSVFQMQPDDLKAIDILGFIAALPYTDSDPTQARAWVDHTLPSIKSLLDVRENTFGGVFFKLYGGPDGRYLEMGKPAR